MDILNKAMELGEMIADSMELARLKTSELMLDSDEHARKLMNDYKELQIELVRATKSKMERASVEEIKELLINKQKELNDYSITNEYLEAKNGFDSLMNKINNVITYAITGDEQCSSGNCGSCSGCS
jgi:cell fate (sporulation/competence/biofilm development) regulator YlbF (YheA/YmcA/DUF963 family)